MPTSSLFRLGLAIEVAASFAQTGLIPTWPEVQNFDLDLSQLAKANELRELLSRNKDQTCLFALIASFDEWLDQTNFFALSAKEQESIWGENPLMTMSHWKNHIRNFLKGAYFGE